MARGFGQADPPQQQYKDEIDIAQLLTYFGFEVSNNGMCCCPFHADDTPSLWVENGLAWCFGCGEGWDLIDLTAKLLNAAGGPEVGFYDTLGWLGAHKYEIQAARPPAAKKKKREYKGPVERYIVDRWHENLTDAHYTYFANERGLTRETVDLHLLGWRPDYGAYVVPFWVGEPQASEIEIVQFRTTEHSPSWLHTKFVGLTGHNKPSFIGRHTLTEDWCLLLFGTFDALLAVQDGWPVISPNGVSSWTSEKRAKELNQIFEGVHRIYVVRDATESEHSSVQKMLDLLEGKEIVVYDFPQDLKDYGDYRKVHSISDFAQDILRFEFA